MRSIFLLILFLLTTQSNFQAIAQENDSLPNAPLFRFDHNSDSVVDGKDLLFLSQRWGQSAGDNTLLDVNGDGIVSQEDLLSLPGEWHQYQGKDLNAGDGGSVKVGLIELDIPRGAFEPETILTVGVLEPGYAPPMPSNALLASSVLSINIGDNQPAVSIRAQIPYDANYVASQGLSEDELSLMRWTEEGWVEEAIEYIDEENQVIIARLSHFSIFAIGSVFRPKIEIHSFSSNPKAYNVLDPDGFDHTRGNIDRDLVFSTHITAQGNPVTPGTLFVGIRYKTLAGDLINLAKETRDEWRSDLLNLWIQGSSSGILNVPFLWEGIWGQGIDGNMKALEYLTENFWKENQGNYDTIIPMYDAIRFSDGRDAIGNADDNIFHAWLDKETIQQNCVQEDGTPIVGVLECYLIIKEETITDQNIGTVGNAVRPHGPLFVQLIGGESQEFEVELTEPANGAILNEGEVPTFSWKIEKLQSPDVDVKILPSRQVIVLGKGPNPFRGNPLYIWTTDSKPVFSKYLKTKHIYKGTDLPGAIYDTYETYAILPADNPDFHELEPGIYTWGVATPLSNSISKELKNLYDSLYDHVYRGIKFKPSLYNNLSMYDKSQMAFSPISTFIIRSEDQNNNPKIVSSPYLDAIAGQEYQYQVMAEDPDQGDRITKYVLLNHPDGMEISDTGLITWTPSKVGSAHVVIAVEDTFGQRSMAQVYTITIKADASEEDPIPPARIEKQRFIVNQYTSGNPMQVVLTVWAVPPPGGEHPKGIVISEIIPKGWKIQSTEPENQYYDEITNEYAWLLYDQYGVTQTQIKYYLVPENENTTAPGEITGRVLYWENDQAEIRSMIGDQLVEIVPTPTKPPVPDEPTPVPQPTPIVKTIRSDSSWKDATIKEEKNTQNLGAYSQIDAIGKEFNKAFDRHRFVIQFPVQSPGSGQQIDSVKLNLNAHAGIRANVQVYRLTKSWEEGNGNRDFTGKTIDENGVSWNNHSSGSKWSSVGADYGELISNTYVGTGGWFAFDITQYYSKVLSGEWENHGLLFMIKDDNSARSEAIFYSTEHAQTDKRPYLQIQSSNTSQAKTIGRNLLSQNNTITDSQINSIKPMQTHSPHPVDLNGDWIISHADVLYAVDLWGNDLLSKSDLDIVISLWIAGAYHVDENGEYVPGTKTGGGDFTGETITIPLDLPSGAKPLEMVHIPAGTFTMGSPSTESGRDSDEGPQHQVTITKDFYLGKYEVTQAQWEAVMGSNPSSSYGVRPNYPVYNVSWNDCQSYIEKLNQMGQGTFRLPTEAEWEYACRAGTQTRFYWGDDPNETQIKDYAWYDGNNSPSGTKEVGLKIPNAFGLYDMSGNVWEWCSDWYGSYPSGSVVDPVGPYSGSHRVNRGGDWGSNAQACRSASRGGHSPDGRASRIGFRLLRSSDTTTPQPKQYPFADDLLSFFPLDIGNEWTYRWTEQESATNIFSIDYSMTIIGTIIIEEDLARLAEFKIIGEMDEVVGYNAYGITSDGLVGADGKEENNVFEWLILPPDLTINSTWPELWSERYSSEITLTVWAVAGVSKTVPAGTFQDVLVIKENDPSNQSFSYSYYYYARGVGLIKEEIYTSNRNILVKSRELLSYSLNQNP